MSISISRALEIQSTLYRAVREALANANDVLAAWELRITEWPVERPACLYALSLTLDDAVTNQELGECRFLLDLNGNIFFDADDAPIHACAPSAAECESAIARFVSRRLVRDMPEKIARAA